MNGFETDHAVARTQIDHGRRNSMVVAIAANRVRERFGGARKDNGRASGEARPVVLRSQLSINVAMVQSLNAIINRQSSIANCAIRRP
jgi:hypothetical protein